MITNRRWLFINNICFYDYSVFLQKVALNQISEGDGRIGMERPIST